MSIDLFRLGEAGVEAALVLGSTTLPAAWNVLDAHLAAALGAMWLLLTFGVYALHAVTFDCFRLTGQRRGRFFRSHAVRSEPSRRRTRTPGRRRWRFNHRERRICSD
jgi:hypothetical protein